MPLSWTASTTSGATYRIYQNNVQVGTATGTSFTATGLTTLTTYTFEVTAYADGMESVRSNAVTVTTA